MDSEWLAGGFEQHRSHLRAVAYRMLGSFAEADDAVQDAWERADRAGTGEVENLQAWLTTIVARVCLNMLRSRHSYREEPLEEPLEEYAPGAGTDPEEEALLADSVGLALQVVLDTLSPGERVAFVLHDMFDLPFEEIAPMVGRSPQATRQLASRGRRRIRAAGPPGRDLARQRAVVDAFFAAGRAGDFDALVAVLHPDVVARTDVGPGGATVIRGAATVAEHARRGAGRGASLAELHPAVVNGAVGAVITLRGRPQAVMAFTLAGDRIAEIDTLADPGRVAELAAPLLAGTHHSGP